MESGKLFMVKLGSNESIEISLTNIGISKKVVGMSDFFKYLWTEDGEIYEYVPEKTFKLISDH